MGRGSAPDEEVKPLDATRGALPRRGSLNAFRDLPAENVPELDAVGYSRPRPSVDAVSSERSPFLDAPVQLIDPEGKGIYIHEDAIPSPLLRAAHLFYGDWRRWNEIDNEGVWMRQKKDSDEWERAEVGRHPRGWKLNLPHRWFPVERYVYCTPKPESM